MSRNRFTTAVPVRLQLSDGDWIEVKSELNNGEQKALECCGQQDRLVMLEGKPVHPIDWEVYEIERAMIFLLDWSFRDANDKAVKVSTDALKALDPADFEELNKAIFNHIIESKAKKALAKKMGATPTPSGSASDQTSA